MAKNKESISYVFGVAFAVCLVCAIIVSTAAVVLRPVQVQNQEFDFKRNILSAAGLLEEGKTVDELFAQVETKVVDIDAGTFSDQYNADSFDPVKAIRDPATSEALPSSIDIAGIKRRENFTEVYLVRDNDGDISTVILPVRGYGLWSTMWGFIALESDLNTVVGLGFYQQAETPGLGGEIDNPNWKAQWPGKQVYGSDDSIAIEVTQGGQADPNSEYQIDGLSGATLTTIGVNNLVHFWLGDNGFKPFLDNLREGDA